MTYCPYCSNHQTKLVRFKILSDGIVVYECVCQMCSKHFWVEQVQVKEI